MAVVLCIADMLIGLRVLCFSMVCKPPIGIFFWVINMARWYQHKLAVPPGPKPPGKTTTTEKKTKQTSSWQQKGLTIFC
jgi:hypothetical protein